MQYACKLVIEPLPNYVVEMYLQLSCCYSHIDDSDTTRDAIMVQWMMLVLAYRTYSTVMFVTIHVE